jgi:hypothetical protein
VGRILLAIRVFFRTLFQAETARQVAALLSDTGPPGTAKPQAAPAAPTSAAPASKPSAPAPKPAPKPKPGRSDALNLLAALQREARFVDFIREPIDGYSDAQIGAAVRDVHRDCGAVLERMFALRPLAQEAEGQTLEVGEGFDAARIRLSGNVGKPPITGTVRHHGWEATRTELPEWVGGEGAAKIVAPIELEVR